MPESTATVCRVLGRAAVVLLWLIAGIVILIAVFPWLARLDARRCDAVRLRWFRGLARLLRLRLEAAGRPATGPILVVANHIGWLDIVVLGCQTPLTFAAKEEVARWPLIGTLARRSGTLFLRRGNLRSVQRVRRAIGERLRRGERVAIFPEGTTTRGDRVLPFAPSLLQAAIDSGVPVQPVTLAYPGAAAAVAPFVGEDTFAASLWRLLRLPEVNVRCHWHPPIQDRCRRTLARRARTVIATTSAPPVAARRAG